MVDAELDVVSQLLSHRKTLNIENSVETLKAIDAGSLAINLNKAVNQYKQLKRIFLGLQFRLYLCEALKDPEELDQATIDDELSDTQSRCKAAKKEIEEYKMEIEELAEQLDRMLTVYREKYEELKELHDTVSKEKMDLDAQMQEESGQDTDKADNHALVLERVSHELVHMKKLQNDWQMEITSLKNENRNLEGAVRNLEIENQELDSKLKQFKDNNDTWMIDTVEQLTAISGIQVKSFSGTVLALQLLDQQSDHNTSVELTIELELDENKEHVIKTASLSNESLCVSDLIEEAVAYNDLAMLVTSIKNRWLMTHRLVKEVESLRNKYALDWRSNDNVVQVLYGDVICSLKLDSSYPQPGSITLQSVTGYPDISSLQPPPEVTTLSHWLEFLQQNILPGKNTEKHATSSE